MCSISERAEAHTKDLHLSQWAQDIISDLQSQLAALREENERLRNALVGLVGSDDSTELLEMKKQFDLMPIPNDERQKTVAAIDALLGKECAK